MTKVHCGPNSTGVLCSSGKALWGLWGACVSLMMLDALKKYEDYISVNRLSTNSWQVFFSKKHVSICVAIRHDFPEKKRFVNLPENSDAMDQAEENALWTFGNGWYGRCLITGEEGKLTCRKTIYTKPGLTG